MTMAMNRVPCHNAPPRTDRTPVRRLWWLGLLAATVAGAWLRLWHIGAQVLVDDEWHAAHYVVDKTFPYLFTHFSVPGATCIPLNLYRLWLLETPGWNELLMRLPLLLAGILTVPLVPWAARSLLSVRAVVLFSAFMAVSPFLIFYSRMCRPYSLVALCAGLSVFLACRWAASGRARYAAGYVFCGALAVYAHLFAVVAVMVPAVAAFGGNRLRVRVDRRQALLVLGALLAVISITTLPALLSSLQSTLPDVAGAGQLRAATVWRCFSLFSGTAHPVLIVAFGLLMVTGWTWLARTSPFAGVTFLSMVLLYPAALWIAAPHSSHVGIVAARYSVALFPVGYALAACGLDRVLTGLAALHRRRCTRTRAGCHALAGAFVITLVAAGPLPQTYVEPNNFTNHSAFQQSYAPIDWNQSFASEMAPPDFSLDVTIQRTEVASFYERLAQQPDVDAVIEFPMMIGDHFNPFYYYQRVHRKRVIVGYCTGVTGLPGLAAGNVFGNTFVDQVLSRVPDTGKLRFSNMVNLDDPDAVRASGADIVICHKAFEADLSRVAPPHPCMQRLLRESPEAFGPAVYDDTSLAAFRVMPPATTRKTLEGRDDSVRPAPSR